jgi:hypothetical protein
MNQMKRTMLLSLFILIKINCFGQIDIIDDNPNKIKDIVKEDLKGKVNKVSITKYDIMDKFGEPTDIRKDSVAIIFNIYGSYISKFEYPINEKWYANCINAGSSKCYSSHYNYNYSDSSNCLISESGKKAGYDSYRVDNNCENGNVQNSLLYFHDNNNPTKKYVYEYDSKGNCLKEEVYIIKNINDDGTIETIWQYSYNSKNKIVEDKKFNSHGMLKKMHVYNYDINARMISKDDYEKEYKLKLITSKKYMYDEKNNVISISGTLNDSYGSKTFGFRYKYIYDSNGNILEEKKTFPNGGSIIYLTKYSNYDNKGNWCEKTDYYDNKPFKKTKRVIEYF